ncbi:hypothetical protein D3C85_620240 [compost metagenome]
MITLADLFKLAAPREKCQVYTAGPTETCRRSPAWLLAQLAAALPNIGQPSPTRRKAEHLPA